MDCECIADRHVGAITLHDVVISEKLIGNLIPGVAASGPRGGGFDSAPSSPAGPGVRVNTYFSPASWGILPAPPHLKSEARGRVLAVNSC